MYIKDRKHNESLNAELAKQVKAEFPETQIDPPTGTIIVGATSPETAVLNVSYPYGSLRCLRRIWLETNKHGTRVCTQTNNPKVPGIRWNKPHNSTYSRGVVVLYVDDEGHVEQAHMDDYIATRNAPLNDPTAKYSEGIERIKAFRERYVIALTNADHTYLHSQIQYFISRIGKLQAPHAKATTGVCSTCNNYFTSCTGQTVDDTANAVVATSGVSA